MFLACQYGRDARLNVRMTVFISAAFDFFLAIDAPERLPLETVTKIGMRRASDEIHGCAAGRTGRPISCTEVLAFIYTHT